MAEFHAIILGRDGKDTREMVGFVLGIERQHVKNLAEYTQKVIRRIITSRVSRPGSTGRLADWAGRIESIDVLGESVAGVGKRKGYGVGNIDDLNQNVPYWRHVNYGSLAINANWIHAVPRGSFVPGDPQPNRDAFRTGRWTPGAGDYIFTPSQPVPAMNYIEATVSEINSRASAILARVTPRNIGVLG